MTQSSAPFSLLIEEDLIIEIHKVIALEKTLETLDEELIVWHETRRYSRHQTEMVGQLVVCLYKDFLAGDPVKPWVDIRE